MVTALDNYQPLLVLNETLTISGIFPARDSFNSGMTMAMVHTYAFNFGLAGAPTANGQVLGIGQNTALFSLIGTIYGGNGQTTFALPDLNGRSAVGEGQGPGLGLVNIGQQSGAASTILAQAQLPSSLGGQNSAVDEDGPSLCVKYLIRSEGLFPQQGGGGASLGYVGSVVKFASNFVPGGYLECNGQLLDISQYEALFQLIGTTYGGDGQTTFALPDLRGRTAVGAGGNYALGDVFGQEDVIITQANLPANMGGSGTAVDNREPSVALNYVIALTGIYPSQGGGADSDTPMLGEVITFAGNFAPSGFALCQGQLLPINQNQALFSLLGTTYGGNGVTNFALPDLRGRGVAGMGPSVNIGEQLGTDQIVLTSSDFPDLIYSGNDAAGTHYGGDGNDTINGLGGGDTIIGNGGNDRLNGGLGIDTLSGFGGNDNYYVDNALDVVIEAVGRGTDRVWSAGSYTLAAGQEIETLSTTSAGGFNAINLTGNAFNNSIFGNYGANALNGGLGVDTLTGLLGNDNYFLDNALDVVIEAVGGGTDRVWSAVSYTLATGQEIETLSTTSAGGVNAINLTGNAFNNTIFGNSGANVLNGGLGNDTLSGLLGADTFVFNTALNAATNRDTIMDYNSAADTIRLENTGAGLFNTLALGVLNALFFKANATGTATDADDRIIYNTVTGALFYDSNGNAAGGAIQFATLNTHPVINAADFVVV